MIARPPESGPVERFLDHASRRLAWLGVARGIAAAVALAAAVRCVQRIGWPAAAHVGDVVIALVLAAVGAGAGWFAARRLRREVAYAVERRAPVCRNLLITADELLTARDARPIAARVYRDADRVVSRLALPTLFPAHRTIIALLGGSALWLAAGVRTSSGGLRGAVHTALTGNRAPEILRVDATITPPPYTGRAPQTLRDPARIEALAGSRVHLVVQATTPTLTIETLTSHTTLVDSTGKAFTIDVAADADGFIALAPHRDSADGPRKLIGLSVTPDAAPRVRIVAPGRDVHLSDLHTPLDVAIEAVDDIGLSSLRLRYTKVSGSGERFTFAEGEVPITTVRANARSWTAHVRWTLDALQLSPGDMVVYRAVAADARPGAPASESDSYIAELAAPGSIAAAGFSIDPDQERYAVSQQMVILKTERLLARRSSTPDSDYTDEAQLLAAEQRKVRAEFVFMMGGELEDASVTSTDMTTLNETAEAEGESDLAAGRQLNQGRTALTTATRAMSRAAGLLTNVDLASALVYERQALAQLERAFSHARILLRALTQQERLDPSRRLSGALGDVIDDARAVAVPERDPRTAALRDVLAKLAAVAGANHLAKDDAARSASLAESLLRVDAADSVLQQVATQLTTAGTAIARGDERSARQTLDLAARSLATTIRGRLPVAPAASSSPAVDRMNGALVDALRRSGGR